VRVADTIHTLSDAGDGRVLLDQLRFARSMATRMKGLLGRRSLDEGEGLAFREKSIHMLFMRMPIDAVFCDGELHVVKVVAELRPWRFAASRNARFVLEIAAGDAARLGIAPGVALRAEPPL
jgi:uncharacterized membrane protein (UPF0127 family)